MVKGDACSIGALKDHRNLGDSGVDGKCCARSECGWKAFTEFSRHSGRRDGYERFCKGCESRRKRASYVTKKRHLLKMAVVAFDSCRVGFVDEFSASSFGSIIGDVLRELLEDEKI